MKKIIQGDVWLNEDYDGESFRNYYEITDSSGETIDNILYDYEGKKVRVTIEVID